MHLLFEPFQCFKKEALMGNLVVPPEGLTIQLPLAQLIAAGRYHADERGHAQIAENFPIEEDDTANDLEELHLKRTLKTPRAFEEIDRLGFVPAKIRGTLIWGALHPENQRHYPIIGLGSSWQAPTGDQYSPCLNRYGEQRRLYLRWWRPDGGTFYPDCRFLVRPKT